MSFSATEAAFEGFRVTRQNPLAILLWAGVWLVGLILAGLIAGPLTASFAGEIEAAGGDVTALSPQATQALTTAMFGVLPVMLVLQALLAPAAYRAVLEPDKKRFGFIRLGRTEARMLAVVVVTTLISVGLSAGGDLLIRMSQGAGLLASVAINLASFALSLWVGVRLSLVAPLVMRRPGLPFREGWRMAGKIFWPLLGIMIVSIVMAAIVALLLVLISWPLTAAMTSGGGQGLAVALVMLLLIPFGLTLVSVLIWTPFAAVMQQLDAG